MEPRLRTPLAATLAWVGVILICVGLTGSTRFTGLYAVSLVVCIAIVGGELIFLNLLFRRGRHAVFPAFRKFTGYAVVAAYIAQSLPRAGWEISGLITDDRAVFLYVLALLCTAAGVALWIVLRARSTLLAFGVITAEEAKDPALLRQRRRTRKRSLLVGVLEWADSLVYAVIMVLLINIFAFQLYAVPSESMVPVFLAGDRPLTLKFLAGPRLPLTEWRLPFMKQPARGDVVTIANPRYPENSHVSLKKYLSQALYMVTLTLVNIDKTAADGTLKADPLVKRIVGLPGEKLMMVDDVLYSRTMRDREYRPVAADAERYSQVDLWKLAAPLRARISTIPADQRTREVLAAWDARKNGADPAVLVLRLQARWTRLQRGLEALSPAVLSAFEKRELARASPQLKTLRDDAMLFAPAGADNPASRLGAGGEDLSLALAAARSPSTRAAFKEYASAGDAAQGRAGSVAGAGPTAYERGSRALNLLIKENLLARMERDAALIAGSATLETVAADPERTRLVTDAGELFTYLNEFYDSRNFPEFPSADAWLGPDQYFAMGDNRYNSLDFRFSTQSRMRALDPADPTSILYPSIMAPFPLEKRFIEGYAIVRLWPLSRIGAVR